MRTGDYTPGNQTPGLDTHHQRADRRRAIGAFGTAARVVVELLLLGSEVLAVTSWVLRRDDQVGRVVFGPVDHLEGQVGRRCG